MTNPASEKQLSFLRKLAEERKGNSQADTVLAFLDRGEVPPTSRHASNTIELLMQIKIQRAAAPAASSEPLEPGMYRKDDVIYKVQKSTSTGNLYAKKLLVDDAGGIFNYAPGIVRILTAADRMTLDQAKQFGALYGTCIVCGRTLTNEVSISEGIGPVCAKRV